MKSIKYIYLITLGSLGLSVNAAQIFPIVNQMPISDNSVVINLKNTAGTDAVLNVDVMKWDTTDDDGNPITALIPLTDEEKKKFIVTKPSRGIVGDKEYATRISYLGERGDYQGAYRVLFKITPKVNSITNVGVTFIPTHNVPLLIDPLVKNENIQITKVGKDVVVKNIGNVAFKSLIEKIDGKPTDGSKSSPVLLPNKSWTIKNTNSIELGKNIYK